MTLHQLTIALDRYDRHVPFFMGLVAAPPGFELRALEVGMVPPRRDGVERHKRMLHGHEFDVAETSLASYIMAKAAGAPFTAVPVFPRRLFSQNHVWIHPRSGVERPRDLLGKRVAIWAFQVTMSVLAKGDLQAEYAVPWREVRWVAEHAEEIPWSGDGATIERVPEGRTGADMLLAGEVDAYIDPHPPEPILSGENGVRRLFADPRAACLAYYQKHGHYPIMHLLAMRAELAEQFPDLPAALIAMWEESKRQAEEFYCDLNYTAMPFGRWAVEENARLFGGDLWPSGVKANRANLERFIGYMADQQLIDRPIAPEDLFHPSVRDT